MLTGEIRNQVDRIWDAFWSGGISNPLEVIEQITYLLFLRRLDDLQALEENKATRLGKPIERRILPPGKDPKKRPYEQLRWSRFKNLEPREMFTIVCAGEAPGDRRASDRARRDGPSRLYESPFTDINPRGPEGVFSSREVDTLVSVLKEIRGHAAA